jgi:chromosome segregation ATPase
MRPMTKRSVRSAPGRGPGWTEVTGDREGVSGVHAFEDTTPVRQDKGEKLAAQFSQIESEVRRLTSELEAMRGRWEQEKEQTDLQTEFETLREAVLRYAIACGQVDVQVAVLRARGDTSGDITENLRRNLEEQNEASMALRALARSLQNPDRSR